MTDPQNSPGSDDHLFDQDDGDAVLVYGDRDP